MYGTSVYALDKEMYYLRISTAVGGPFESRLLLKQLLLGAFWKQSTWTLGYSFSRGGLWKKNTYLWSAL